MTNRELLQKAMQLVSLTEEEWNEIVALQNKATGCLYTALETLVSNQAKLEISSCYKDYYGDRLDEPVPEKKVSVI